HPHRLWLHVRVVSRRESRIRTGFQTERGNGRHYGRKDGGTAIQTLRRTLCAGVPRCETTPQGNSLSGLADARHESALLQRQDHPTAETKIRSFSLREGSSQIHADCHHELLHEHPIQDVRSATVPTERHPLLAPLPLFRLR
ncbi:hypothetical protein PMAYCL1PPCAC_11835, partial [Pristionchus mayeri]